MDQEITKDFVKIVVFVKKLVTKSEKGKQPKEPTQAELNELVDAGINVAHRFFQDIHAIAANLGKITEKPRDLRE